MQYTSSSSQQKTSTHKVPQACSERCDRTSLPTVSGVAMAGDFNRDMEYAYYAQKRRRQSPSQLFMREGGSESPSDQLRSVSPELPTRAPVAVMVKPRTSRPRFRPRVPFDPGYAPPIEHCNVRYPNEPSAPPRRKGGRPKGSKDSYQRKGVPCPRKGTSKYSHITKPPDIDQAKWDGWQP